MIKIGLPEAVPRLAAILDKESPFEHDVFGDRQDALIEHRPQYMRQPVTRLSQPDSASQLVSAAICGGF
jgi:hypothetical protein